MQTKLFARGRGSAVAGRSHTTLENSYAVQLGVSALALAAVMVLAPSPAAAQAQPAGVETISIPPQDLNGALEELGEETGLQIAYRSADVDGRMSSGVQGRYRPQDALALVLAGTGLSFQQTGEDAVMLVAAAEAGDGDGAIRLGTLGVAGEAPAYQPAPSSLATKTTLPLEKTPFTINQASEELIRERGDSSIYETLERFAGVTSVSSNGDIGQSMSRSINVRGFSVSGNNQLLINGQRTYGSAGSARSAYSLEAVEVLRGPAALYYGAAEPGGVVNYAYKRPQEEARHVVLASTDDQGSYGGMIDTTGPLNEGKTLLYRLAAGYDRYEDDQDHIFQEPASILGALTFKPTSKFETTFTYEWLDVESVPEQENNKLIGEGPDEGEYYPVPRDFFWGSLNDRAVRETHTFLWDARWEASEYFTIKTNATYQDYEQWWQNTRINSSRGSGNPAPDAEGNVPRYVSGRQSEGSSWSVGADVTGMFDTGPFFHEWLVGGGFGHEEGRSSGRAVASETRPGGAYEVGPINIYDPVYRDWPYQYRIWDDPLGEKNEREDTNFYLQDLISLPNEKTRVMLAAGWSQYEDIPSNPDQANKTDKWSPRIALMHDLTPDLMVYASYGQSFSPNSLGMLDGAGDYITTPQEGSQYEIGLKQVFSQGRAVATASVFRIEKENMPMPLQDAAAGECDPEAAPAPGEPASFDGTGDCRYQLNGLEVSQGAEVEVSGRFTDWWSGTASYAYLDTEYDETDDLASLGRTFPYTPKHNLSVWNKFDVLRTEARGKVSLGIGATYWSKGHGSWGEPDASGNRTSYNDAYTLVNAGLFWDDIDVGGKDLKISLNVDNLFDKTYYDRRRFPEGGTIVWGDERRFSLSAQLEF
ncbi:TonB-dependent siderophore receptor [Henriciella aquimarina]|uniref:TonB-dependent siderophore receptor n=1 Tax=Henriciella aquimarina TaxID=545261 RepID=UPI000A03B2F3|nr:TonB-dependent receptor [Henriciella aquimarina]